MKNAQPLIGDRSTPALLLDEAKMLRNIRRLEERARSLGVTLRPHLKTAKSVDVAKRLNGGLAPPITVSTFAEAEVFFAAGFRAILYAVGIAPQKLARIQALRRAGCDLVVVLDSVAQAKAVTRCDACPATRYTRTPPAAGGAMTFQRQIGRTGGLRVKRALGIQAALEWAFRIEKAQLELPLPKDTTGESFGFGLEYVLMQRAVLGCKVDGGQYKMSSYTDPDAEVIAATFAGMPDSLGGIRMAIRVTEQARAGLTPDWMPGVMPRCVPVETKQNQHGERAMTIVVGTERILTRGKWRTVEVMACPVTWRPHPEQIASARRGYEDWWRALDWVRDGLIAGGMLREVKVTEVVPKVRPWKTG